VVHCQSEFLTMFSFLKIKKNVCTVENIYSTHGLINLVRMSILLIFKPNLNRRPVPVIKRCHMVNTPEYCSFQKVEFHPHGRLMLKVVLLILTILLLLLMMMMMMMLLLLLLQHLLLRLIVIMSHD